MDRAFSPWVVSMDHFLGLYPRLVLCAPLVLGKGRTANGRRWTPVGMGRWGRGTGYPQMTQITADGGRAMVVGRWPILPRQRMVCFRRANGA